MKSHEYQVEIDNNSKVNTETPYNSIWIGQAISILGS